MLPSIQSLVKNIPVENSTRLEEYLKTAATLKSMGKAQHEKEFFVDVMII
jgi:hypothetical protein